MATAADWNDRFDELTATLPPDGRAIWTLIVECMEDNNELAHTFNAVLKTRGVPRRCREDLRQDLALSLVETIRTSPNLNLHHRWPGVTAAGWLYGVIDKLCADLLRSNWAKERRHVNGAAASPDGGVPIANDVLAEESKTVDEHQLASFDAVDAVFDLRAFLAACDDWTRRVVLAFLVDFRVRTVATELDIPYATAWRAVREVERQLRERMDGYH